MANDDDKPAKVEKTPEQWRAELTPQQYEVLFNHGTERAFTGPYWDDHEPGSYLCAACGLELFGASDKYDSGSGWPSFSQPLRATHVATTTDETHGMTRTEVRCARCDGHLGHVFDDGPRPTGLRYCINGTALKKIPA